MPVKVRSIGHGKFRVSTPSGVHAKSTSKGNAIAQARILRAIDHGWKPDKSGNHGVGKGK